jgi:hypothetical protein
LPIEKAADRAAYRYSEEGRLLDPHYVLGVGNKPMATFKKLIEEGYADESIHLDNDVPRGEAPRLAERTVSRTTEGNAGGTSEQGFGPGRQDSRPDSRSVDAGQAVGLTPHEQSPAAPAGVSFFQDTAAARKQIETPEFKAWFGNSKVAKNGEPIVLYHATSADINAFDRSRLGENTASLTDDDAAQGTAKLGFWMHERPLAQEVGATTDMPVYAAISNPKDIAQGNLFIAVAVRGWEDVLNDLRADGYDGLRVADEEFGGTSYVAFDPEQIKSATGNRGTFDRADARVLYQNEASPPFYSAVKRTIAEAPTKRAKGSQWLGMLKNKAGVKPDELKETGIGQYLETRADLMKGLPLFQKPAPVAPAGAPKRGQISLSSNQAIIKLFMDADESTFLHESGHLWLDELERDAMEASAPGQTKADWQTVREWLGAEEGAEITVAQHEQWARGFEAYLREGVAPSEMLARAFEAFKQWLMKIYASVTQLDVELSADVRAVMGRMLKTPERADPPVEPEFKVPSQAPIPERPVQDFSAVSQEADKAVMIKDDLAEAADDIDFIQAQIDGLEVRGLLDEADKAELAAADIISKGYMRQAEVFRAAAVCMAG